MLLDAASAHQQVANHQQNAGERIQAGVDCRKSMNRHEVQPLGLVTGMPTIDAELAEHAEYIQNLCEFSGLCVDRRDQWLRIMAAQMSGRYAIEPKKSRRAETSDRVAANLMLRPNNIALRTSAI